MVQIWQHDRSEQYYAVELDSREWIVGAAGPLNADEIGRALAGDYTNNPDVAHAIKLHGARYYDVTEEAQRAFGRADRLQAGGR